MRRTLAMLAAGAAVLTLARPVAAQNILVYDNSSHNQFALDALDLLGYAYVHATSTDFATQLSTGPAGGGSWDLVIMDHPSTAPSGTWTTEVSTYVAGGGAFIGSSWESSSVSDLAAPLEYSYGSSHGAVELYRWDTTHPIFTSPNAVPDITTGIVDYWGTNGYYMDPTGTAVVVGGGPTPYAATMGLIVIGNDGRTIMNGFLYDDYESADNDADTINDCVELLQNEILFIVDVDADRDGDGYTIATGDCNDWNDMVHPGITTDYCDGQNNDCDTSTPDGWSETWYGTPCDGTDPDLCADGIEVCIGGVQTCNDGPDESPDICDGFDNDCDPTSADGSEDDRVGAPCDGDDLDLCEEGTGTCVSGVFVCTDDTDDLPDLCDGTDDDCDPSTPDGSSETWLGDACDGDDPDLCDDGAYVCEGGVQTCEDPDDLAPDICDGIDNDCNPGTPDGSGDERVGAACDGEDADECAEGIGSCEDGVFVCSDTMDDTPELCDGIDNDCNPSTVDGVEEDWYLAPCDGADGDLCEEGQYDCISGIQVCTDSTGEIREVCNGADDDCDPATEDGADETWIGDPCDGADADLCAEGHLACVDGAEYCDDLSADNFESCNGVDDDCNPATNENADNDGDGISACAGDCNDGDSSIYPGAEEICDGIDQDCDPMTDRDGDGDGYRDCDDDCDDMNPNIHPDAEIDCTNGQDNDCNGIVDSDEPVCAFLSGGDGGCGCALAGRSDGPGILGALAIMGLALAALALRRR